MNVDKYIFRVESWETPATSYPLKKCGVAEINRKKYSKGYYFMEGVAGKVFFYVAKPIQVTLLKINNRIWMVDDPLHWIGMQKLAEHSNGKVLTAGLGLGLLSHALSYNENVERIDVVELNRDVIDLVSPLIPEKVNVYHGNVFDYKDGDYDTIILDLWVWKKAPKGISSDMIGTFVYFKHYYPKSKVYVWGLTNSAINPAVDVEARRIFEKCMYNSRYW